MTTRRSDGGRRPPPLGAFVTVPRNGLGIGKLVAIEGDQATIEYFDVPVTGGVVIRQERLSNVVEEVLQRQHRVWWFDGARWHVGRVDMPPDEDGNYLVAFPDQRLIEVPMAELRVRFARPLVDPLRLLVARTVETRFFHIHRSRFLSMLLDQRAACDDVGGILSSSVELHLHQVAAARRVLSDPVQRYLLADEVGLGKTIEAGMVIRQLLIDDDHARVVVVVPEGIVNQWRDELEAKFRVDWFDGEVEVLPHRWLVETKRFPDVDLLVVDEAHRLTGTGDADQHYERLRTMAADTPRLLLLSATPVRSNEDAFLKMLHLLDPLLYPLDQPERFRERVLRRDDVAVAVTSLAENTPLFLLPGVVDQLRTTFPDDAVLGGHLDALAAAIAANDVATGEAARRAAKTHVSETYRLHRRLIRTRRNERLQATFPVRLRRRAEPWTLEDPDRGRAAILRALDAFRVGIAGETKVDPLVALRLVAGRLGAARPAVAALTQALGGGKQRAHDLNADDAAVAAAIGRLTTGRALRSDLEAALATEPGSDRIDTMVDWAWKHVNRAKLAVCSEFTSVARAARHRMEERYGIKRVAALLSDMTSAELADELERARDDELCIVLVCDRVAEEGWNLQFVDTVLHLDLPWSVNRLEQRLGRFDRFAGQTANAVRTPIRSITVADRGSGDRLTGAWRRVLDEGFGVFERSTASLQYVLPEYEDRLLGTALVQGFAAMTEGLDKIGEELELLRRRIDGQDLFDSVDDTEADEAYLAALEQIDDEAGLVRTAFTGWLGALRFFPFSRDGGTGYGIKAQQPPLLPERSLYSLGLHHLRHVYVDSRRAAVRHFESGFLRWGEPLVDRFVQQAELDDRGHAFAVRRCHPAIPTGTPFRPVFRVDVLVSPALDALDAVAAEGTPERRAMERRLRRYLAPWIEGVLLGPRQEELPAAVAAFVEDPRDLDDNLGKRPEEFDELVAGLDWRKLCLDSAEAALGIAASRERTLTRIAAAHNEFRRDAAMHRAQEAARRAYLGGAAGAEALGAVEEAMERALANPSFRVESCGVVFLGPVE